MIGINFVLDYSWGGKTQVRRTKISERMRKLQDLVPNMDKVNDLFPGIAAILIVKFVKIHVFNFPFPWLQQTNTADMLDLAVEYIKDLQKQVKVCMPFLFLLSGSNQTFPFGSFILFPPPDVSDISRHFRILEQNVGVVSITSSSDNCC